MPAEYHVYKSSVESVPKVLEFLLPDGVLLTDVTITHTPPPDSTETPAVLPYELDLPYAIVYLTEAIATLGRHLVSVVAVTDNTDVAPEILLIVTVNR